MSRIVRVVVYLFLAIFLSGAVESAVLPGGFRETRVGGLTQGTAFAFAPDGRIFVCEQTGAVRVIKDGLLLPTPFLTVEPFGLSTSGERGLLGIAFDPNFRENQWVYLYYTATTPNIHNRVARFTAMGDVAVPSSTPGVPEQTIIFELDPLSSATNHNGGAIHFGPDGKLYVAVGENATPSNAQSMSNALGKMLRINRDGSIPSDNPFYNSATGNGKAIWALGLRNPFTFAFQRGTGRMFINDVGASTWEEINDGIVGSNYGWPATEGPTTNPAYRSPIFYYGHGSSETTGCAITGGAFYNPVRLQFPVSYIGKYFFADYCSGWIRALNPADLTSSGFATGASAPVDLHVSSDGTLHYLARDSGELYRVFPTNQMPTADFNEDGAADLLWRNESTGDINVWFLQGIRYASGTNIGNVPGTAWRLEGSGDFDRNDSPDLLWRNYQTGEVKVWFLSGTTYIGGGSLPTVEDSNWEIEGVADFNSDRQLDLVWRNYVTGAVSIWYLDGTQYLGGASLPSVTDPMWKLEGTGDLDADGDPDLIWRNDSSGQVNAWFLQNGMFAGGASVGIASDTNWGIEAIEDYNWDGRMDLVWRHDISGDVNIWFLDGVVYLGGANLFNVPANAWKIEGPR